MNIWNHSDLGMARVFDTRNNSKRHDMWARLTCCQWLHTVAYMIRIPKETSKSFTSEANIHLNWIYPIGNRSDKIGRSFVLAFDRGNRVRWKFLNQRIIIASAPSRVAKLRCRLVNYFTLHWLPFKAHKVPEKSRLISQKNSAGQIHQHFISIIGILTSIGRGTASNQ